MWELLCDLGWEPISTLLAFRKLLSQLHCITVVNIAVVSVAQVHCMHAAKYLQVLVLESCRYNLLRELVIYQRDLKIYQQSSDCPESPSKNQTSTNDSTF